MPDICADYVKEKKNDHWNTGSSIGCKRRKQKRTERCGEGQGCCVHNSKREGVHDKKEAAGVNGSVSRIFGVDIRDIVEGHNPGSRECLIGKTNFM